MTPKETTILKGVAILFMLYLHLFNSMNQVELCTNLICIGGIPLAHILSRCTNPVAIYLLLSGYGLYKTRERLTARNTSRRLAKLYIHYWISMGIFVAIGSVIAPEKYPGTLSDFIVNLTSWHTTYNIQIWFLLPYAIMILTAPYLFELFEKKPVITLGAAAMLWGGGICRHVSLRQFVPLHPPIRLHSGSDNEFHSAVSDRSGYGSLRHLRTIQNLLRR